MAIGDPYTSRSDFKDARDITSNEEDSWIDRCLLGAARALEKRSGWPTFWRTETAVTRSVDTRGKVVPVRQPGYQYLKLLLRDGLVPSEPFTVAGYSTARMIEPGSDLELEPCTAIALPYGASFGINGTIDITGVWGWPEVPSDIAWAHEMQSGRFYRRKGSPEGITGSAEWGLTRIPALDPDVLSILKGGGYMRAGIG